LNSAYIAENLEAQLEQAARSFINDVKLNTMQATGAELSSIFSWFKSDFTRNGGLIDYINQYANVKLNKDAKISYKEYNWFLNE
jgi:hypothetical protein